MIRVSKKKVFNYNYGSRFSLLLIILVPIVTLAIFLSVFDVIPRFPLTESMPTTTGIVILAVGIVIVLICTVFIKKTLDSLNEIVNKGELVTAKITDTVKSKHQILIKYTFEYDGIQYNHRANLAKKLNSSKVYSKDTEIEIYAYMKDNELKSTPNLYV